MLFSKFIFLIGDGALDMDLRCCCFVSCNVWSCRNNVINDLHPDAYDRVSITISYLFFAELFSYVAL